MDEEVLLAEEKDGIVILTMNRPQAMNSFSMRLLYTMREKIEELRRQSDVRVVIITGAGEKVFCAGADLKERVKMDDRDIREFLIVLGDILKSIESLNKPVIAAINGIALGGGTELALASDLRIASMNAVMGLTETRLAVIPGAGGTQRLPRTIGRGKAKELIFTGRRVDAQEALDISLVNHICEQENLMDECLKIANMICETGPIAIQQAKLAINKGTETDLQSGLAIEYEAYWHTVPTEDRLEGLKAFTEKRKPIFKGR